MSQLEGCHGRVRLVDSRGKYEGMCRSTNSLGHTGFSYIAVHTYSFVLQMTVGETILRNISRTNANETGGGGGKKQLKFVFLKELSDLSLQCFLSLCPFREVPL